MSKLEKFLAKAQEPVSRKQVEVKIGEDTWSVRELSLAELRACEKLADKKGNFDWYLYNDARIVKATEHDFPWNDKQLLAAYGVHTKYELPAKLFEFDLDGYLKLREAVIEVHSGSSEADLVEEAKN